MKVEAKTVKIVSFSLVIGILLGSIVAYAATPSSTFWISSGIYPGAPSYTVWREGSNYFAKDAYGEIEFSGTNATEIIQNAIDAVNSAEGGTVFLHGGSGASPAFLCSNSITVKRRVNLIGSSAFASPSVVLRFNADVDGLIIEESDVIVSNIYIDIGYDGYTKSAILVNGTSLIQGGLISDLLIYRNRVAYGYDSATGLSIIANKTNTGVNLVTIRGVVVRGGFKYGFRISANDAAGGTHAWANGNEMISCSAHDVQYGFVIDNSGDGVTNNNLFTNCKVQAVYDANGYTEEAFQIGGDANTLVNTKAWDVPPGNYSIHILSDANGTELIGCRFVYIFDEGTDTLQLTAYSVDGAAYLMVKMAHPITTDWDGNMTGAFYYDTTHNRFEYWNGTHLFYIDATIHP